MEKQANPFSRIAALAAVITTLIAATACEERPSADASAPDAGNQIGSTNTVEGVAPSGTVATDADPTPQTSTGGEMPGQ